MRGTIPNVLLSPFVGGMKPSDDGVLVFDPKQTDDRRQYEQNDRDMPVSIAYRRSDHEGEHHGRYPGKHRDDQKTRHADAADSRYIRQHVLGCTGDQEQDECHRLYPFAVSQEGKAIEFFFIEQPIQQRRAELPCQREDKCGCDQTADQRNDQPYEHAVQRPSDDFDRAAWNECDDDLQNLDA